MGRGSFCYNPSMLLRLPIWRFSERTCALLSLLCLVGASIALAFPRTHWLLRTPLANGIALLLLVAVSVVCLVALWKRRWVSALFHAGAVLVIIGGGLTAGYAQEGELALLDSPIAPTEYRQRVVGGDRVALESFEIETYPNGMPKQYRTRLYFPEGVREVSVNHPLRRKGYTYYQMSYAQAFDPYGRPVWQTILTVRKDPGVPFVFVGYGLLALATLLVAIRSEVRS